MSPGGGPIEFSTARLRAIAATAAVARADVDDRARFQDLIAASAPDSWPIEVMRDVREYFARQLETGAMRPGWGMWYLTFGQSVRHLVGVVGFYGAPDGDGVATIGYGICPEHEGQGFASEALAGVIQWGNARGGVMRYRATTFERHHASVRVLEKCGFVCIGPSPDDANAPEEDRQGRGTLMRWERPA